MKAVRAFVSLAAAMAVVAACAPAPRAVPTHTATPVARTAVRLATVSAVPPAPTPSPTPWLGGLPEGTVALFGMGSQESLWLHALAADGSSINLGRSVIAPAIASPSARWVATFDAPNSASAVVLHNLHDGRVLTVPCGSGCPRLNDYVGTWAFDREERYLAFAKPSSWAPVLVDLADGSTRLFDAASWTGPEDIRPGIPLGWSAAGELVLDTYRPESEGFSAGIWALSLPPDGAPVPTGTLARRPLVLPPSSRVPAPLAEGSQLVDRYWGPRLSPDGARLVFLARDLAYKPADYAPSCYDVAMNQLWALNLASGEATCLIDVRDGGALGGYADWSPDGREVLFVQGRYAGATLSPVALNVWEPGGAIREIGSLPEAGDLASLDWCAAGTAVVGLRTPGGEQGEGGTVLYTVGLATGRAARAAEAPSIEVLGCVR